MPDAAPNLKLVGEALARYGFGGRWAFLDPASGEYLGMSGARCRELLRDADAVID